MDDLSAVASLIADPTRSEILLCLMDGRAFPVSDLAARVHISVSTASHHLEKLVGAGLVEVDRLGRHRYHRIAGERVAGLLELLGGFQPPAPMKLSKKQEVLVDCRVCYNHLAGRTGVWLRQRLEERGYLALDGDCYRVTALGECFFRNLGIAPDLWKSKACLDWTERIPHVGGALGRAVFESFLDRGWIIRGEVPRLILVTPLGRSGFKSLFESDCLETE